MGYMVMAYAEEGYQEFVLPEIYDSDYELTLNRKLFGLKKDLRVLLEIVDGSWKFVKQNTYKLRIKGEESGFQKKLEDGQIYYLKSANNRRITLVVLWSEENFPTYKKYLLGKTSKVEIGKGKENVIRYDFEGYISNSHCVLFRHGNRWVFQDFSSNGSFLDGKRIRKQQYLTFGEQITLFGLRIIFLDSCIAVCNLSGDCTINTDILPQYYPRDELQITDESSVQEKKELFKRSPRMIEKLYTEEIEIEAPPAENKVKKRPLFLTIGPSFTMAIPMFMGCLMSIVSAGSQGAGRGIYMFTGLVTAVSSAIVGVFWAIVNLRHAKREEEENEELRYSAYGQYLIEITEFIKEKYDRNRRILFHTYLSGQECCRIGKEDVRLWNRNERQQDFMTVRIGTGNIPFQAAIKTPKEKFTLIKDDLAQKPAMIRETYRMLQAVPVCMDIREKGVIGIIGGLHKYGAYSVVRNMIAQLAANNCYTDVKMVFLYKKDTDDRNRWEFAKWLPHVWSEDKKTRMIACEKAQAGDIFYELSRVFRIRLEETGYQKKKQLPHYVFIVDDMKLLEDELLEQMILDPKPEYGITTILLTEKYQDLPNSCENIIQNDGIQTRLFHVFDEEHEIQELMPESVDCEELELLARKLCDVKVGEKQGNGEVPNSLDFFEMYDVTCLEQLNVLERWKKNRNYDNMRVPIGKKSGGNLCYLDIHEKYHGPHGLIAGTTGSGKSETLQTYILSLAINFSPEDIAFFIIDFKGGGMANLFSDLPHMAGQISNLSGNQVHRAMISIKSENKRRQRIFAEHNVNNINLYTRLYKNREAVIAIPHLFIIIDEFAELKREEPEFMKELISVAQVGRSLGVHLILATQKPSGTVDDNIWSNSKFRLCLRVQDKQDSNDMLHRPDASYITQAGRGFLQVGNDEIFEQFQSAYSGAEYLEDSQMNQSASAVMMTLTGKEIRAGNNRRLKKLSSEKEKTQLDAVIMHLNKIAEMHGYKQKMLLWLPVLPDRLYLEELKEYKKSIYKNGVWAENNDHWNLETMIGLYDDPACQKQEPLRISFAEGGHLAVCGTVATGKSTFLQTLVYGLINRYTPQELNLYILDYSSRMLLCFEKAPHCGGVILDTEEEKVNKFFFMLERIVRERKQILKGGNYSQYRQNNKNGNHITAIMIVIDNYANFREKTNNRYDDEILRISREGLGYGIFLILSSGGFGVNEIPGRVADNIKNIVSLEMGDKFKYAEVLRTARVEVLPENGVKGRGIACVDGKVLEFQTALPLKAQNSYICSEKIENLCEEMTANWEGGCAKEIPVIPQKPTLQILSKKKEYMEMEEGKRYLPFAYYEKDASVCGVDLWNTYCYIIQGKSRSGKKNVFKLLAYAAKKKEAARVCIIDTGSSELKAFSEKFGIEHISNEKEIYEFFKSTIPIFKERNQKKHRLIDSGMEEEEITEVMNRESHMFIFIADLVSFIQSAYKVKEGVGSMNAYLENITEKGSQHGFYFFSILNPEQANMVSAKKIYHNMISYKTGVHLGGNISAQRLFQFYNIPFQEQSKVTKPGSGLIPSAEDSNLAETIIIPLIKGDIQ